MPGCRVRWGWVEPHLVPQGHLPVVPSGGTGGEQLLETPQEQHLVGPVPLVAGFLEGEVWSALEGYGEGLPAADGSPGTPLGSCCNPGCKVSFHHL